MTNLIDGKYPFIGGPWDGKLHSAYGGNQYVHVAVPPKYPKVEMLFECPTKPAEPAPFKHVTYELKMWSGGSYAVFPVYVIEGMTPAEVMYRLLKKYCAE